jgi:hypothetical protein
VNQSTKYLLLLDPQQEILNLQETTLKFFYNGEIHSFTDSETAQTFLKNKGAPELIIIDSEFVPSLDEEHLIYPIIATSMEPVSEALVTKYPSVTAVIEKPLNAKSFSLIMKGITGNSTKLPTHVSVRFSILLKLGIGHFDLYLKLSETNYVKILHRGEPFFDSDAKKLTDKGIHELYIRVEDGQTLISLLENDIFQNVESVDNVALTIENLEAFEQVAKYLNWPPSVLSSAHKSVTHAVKIISKNQNILSVLKRRLSDPHSPYSHHVGLLTYLVCAFSSSIGWVGESGQVKLALAALIHDASVDDKYYENVRLWNKKATDPTDKSTETIKYRMHPFEALKLVRSLDSLTPDVEQIILQHHEVKDGTGFPRSMDFSRIGHLPALFIIVEDLVEFIEDGKNIETSITDFIMWGRAFYDRGHFKKLFTAFEESLSD